jgi:hypothetical protein
MAHAIVEAARKRKRQRFSYRESRDSSGAAILAHTGQNDAVMRSRFAKSFAGTDANVRLGVEAR